MKPRTHCGSWTLGSPDLRTPAEWEIPPQTKAEAVSGRKYGPCIVTLDFPLATLRKEKETGEINFNYIFI